MAEQLSGESGARAADAIGTVEEVVYRNEANDYTVLELIDNRTNELVTAVGTMPYASEGEEVSLWGEWTHHPDYGKQLAVTAYEKRLPTATSDILRYLSSKAVHGVGPSTALKIVNRFGTETFEVIEKHPEWLTDIPGITPKKAATISASFREMAELRNLMTLCAGHIGMAAATRAFRQWGAAAVSIVRKNPYRLCRDIYGIGFEKADEIAATLGIDRGADMRIGAGLNYVLSYNASGNGHTCLPREKLTAAAAETLQLPEENISDGIEKALGRGDLVCYRAGESDLIFTRKRDEAEQTVCDRLREISNGAVTFSQNDLIRMIERMEAEWGIRYATMQRQAIGVALSGGVMILTGGPGTGKTTVIRALLRSFEILGLKTALAAPTGRAAKRMSEATVHEAKTIHRMLEMERGEDEEPRFHRDEENPLDEMAVIVDEASMIDLPLMAALLCAMRRGAHLILVGDSNQLPSVGCGNILVDLIGSGAFPTVCLNEIFRQAEESLIVTNAHRINRGEMPILNRSDSDFFFVSRPQEDTVVPTVLDLIMNRLPRVYGTEIRNRIQVITPTRKGKSGTEQLNQRLQECLNPPQKGKNEIKFQKVVFRVGDRVMQTRNHYDLEWKRGEHTGTGVYNGDMGVIISVDEKEKKICISFEDRVAEYDRDMIEEIEHAYAITVHKSQGSEYPVVIMPMTYAAPMLQTRNLLYTALTRAREKVILVGREDVIAQMVGNNRQVMRYTALRERLCAGETQQEM